MEQLPEAWRAVETVPDDPPDRPGARAGHARIVVLGILALALASAAGAMLALTPSGSGTPVVQGGSGAATGASPDPGAAEDAWMIDVAGAVMHPGLYALPPGSRVADAIRAAGGYGARVDASAAAAVLNLAEILHDGAKVVVPERGTSTAGGAGAGGAVNGSAGGSAAQGRIDLNRATESELDTLPGIGPVTAARIIAAREESPFQAVDDLLARKVVSASVMTKIRPLVTVGGG